MHVLGISAFYHDSAAALLKDGEIVAAAQEERFTRKKHDAGFPENAIRFCLEAGGIDAGQLDCVAFYDKPLIKFTRILETYLAYPGRGLKSFLMAIPTWLRQKLWIPDLIEKKTGFEGKILFPEHHQSHAASAFFPSPFSRAAFLTIDGVGEWATSSFGVGRDRKIEIMAELKFPHSLGLLYSAFTYFTGFKVNSGEYKVMGLAPYGEPKYVRTILDHLIDLKEDGSFSMNMDNFAYATGLTMTGAAFDELFGGPPRKPESKLTQREMDLARSVQDVTEEIVMRMARTVKKETGEKYLCLAGGVALNCVANGKLLRERAFSRTSGFSPLRAMPEGRSGPPTWRTATTSAGSFRRKRAATSSTGRTWERITDPMQSSSSSSSATPPLTTSMTRSCWTRRRPCLQKDRSSDGSRAGWNSARGRSATAASSAMRGLPRCRRK